MRPSESSRAGRGRVGPPRRQVTATSAGPARTGPLTPAYRWAPIWRARPGRAGETRAAGPIGPADLIHHRFDGRAGSGSASRLCGALYGVPNRAAPTRARPPNEWLKASTASASRAQVRVGQTHRDDSGQQQSGPADSFARARDRDISSHDTIANAGGCGRTPTADDKCNCSRARQFTGRSRRCCSGWPICRLRSAPFYCCRRLRRAKYEHEMSRSAVCVTDRDCVSGCRRASVSASGQLASEPAGVDTCKFRHRAAVHTWRPSKPTSRHLSLDV